VPQGTTEKSVAAAGRGSYARRRVPWLTGRHVFHRGRRISRTRTDAIGLQEHYPGLLHAVDSSGTVAAAGIWRK